MLTCKIVFCDFVYSAYFPISPFRIYLQSIIVTINQRDRWR